MIHLSPLLILLVVFAAIMVMVLAGLRIGFSLIVVGVISEADSNELEALRAR